MRRGQTLNITKRRGCIVAVLPEQKKIADRRIVQFPGHSRVQSNAIQRVAKKKRIPHVRVIKRLDAELIARTKQLFVSRIPDGE